MDKYDIPIRGSNGDILSQGDSKPDIKPSSKNENLLDHLNNETKPFITMLLDSEDELSMGNIHDQQDESNEKDTSDEVDNGWIVVLKKKPDDDEEELQSKLLTTAEVIKKISFLPY